MKKGDDEKAFELLCKTLIVGFVAIVLVVVAALIADAYVKINTYQTTTVRLEGGEK